MFVQSVIKSIQRITVIIPAGASDGATGIAAVNTNNATLRISGLSSASAGSGRYPYAIFASASQVNCHSNFPQAVPMYVNIQIVEYYGGFLRQPIQHLSIVTDQVFSATVAITAVGAKAELVHFGFSTTDYSSGNLSGWETRLELTSPTVVTCYAGTAFYTQTTVFDVIDWK